MTESTYAIRCKEKPFNYEVLKLACKKMKGLKYYLGKIGKKHQIKLYGSSFITAGIDFGTQGDVFICEMQKLPDGTVKMLKSEKVNHGQASL